MMVLATAYSDAEGQMMNTKTPGRSIDIDFHHRAIRVIGEVNYQKYTQINEENNTEL